MLEVRSPSTKAIAAFPPSTTSASPSAPGKSSATSDPTAPANPPRSRSLPACSSPATARSSSKGRAFAKTCKAYRAGLRLRPRGGARLHPPLRPRIPPTRRPPAQMPERLIDFKANRLLSLLGLESWRYSPISLYSKGMKQRVLIAAALLHDPKLLIFDEPLSGLDVVSARLFKDLLAALAAAGQGNPLHLPRPRGRRAGLQSRHRDRQRKDLGRCPARTAEGDPSACESRERLRTTRAAARDPEHRPGTSRHHGGESCLASASRLLPVSPRETSSAVAQRPGRILHPRSQSA